MTVSFWDFSVSAWRIVFSLVVLGAAAWFTFRQLRTGKHTRGFLANELLRLLIVALFLFTLFRPERVHRSTLTQRPLVAILGDASGSMATRDVLAPDGRPLSRATWLAAETDADGTADEPQGEQPEAVAAEADTAEEETKPKRRRPRRRRTRKTEGDAETAAEAAGDGDTETPAEPDAGQAEEPAIVVPEAAEPVEGAAEDDANTATAAAEPVDEAPVEEPAADEPAADEPVAETVAADEGDAVVNGEDAVEEAVEVAEEAAAPAPPHPDRPRRSGWWNRA